MIAWHGRGLDEYIRGRNDTDGWLKNTRLMRINLNNPPWISIPSFHWKKGWKDEKKKHLPLI